MSSIWLTEKRSKKTRGAKIMWTKRTSFREKRGQSWRTMRRHQHKAYREYKNYSRIHRIPRIQENSEQYGKRWAWFQMMSSRCWSEQRRVRDWQANDEADCDRMLRECKTPQAVKGCCSWTCLLWPCSSTAFSELKDKGRVGGIKVWVSCLCTSSFTTTEKHGWLNCI